MIELKFELEDNNNIKHAIIKVFVFYLLFWVVLKITIYYYS